jgi:hypothetical protein
MQTIIPKSITITHWDWTFTTLAMMQRLRRACVSLIAFLRKSINLTFEHVGAEALGEFQGQL